MLNKCESWVREVFEFDTIRYLASSISALEGAPFDLTRIQCLERTPLEMQAGYLWSTVGPHRRGGIILDSSKLTSREHVERVVKHEMVHAFDDARGYIEPSDCYHQACSEIRAARLSGDCDAVSALKSGNVDLFSSGIKCVEKRAVLALENNPICKGFSSRAVDKLMSSCYSDSAPFVAPIPFSGNFENKA